MNDSSNHRPITATGTRPSVLFLNRVYPPAEGATGQLLAELAPALVDAGWRVSVITSRSKPGSLSSESVGGVRVERVGGLPFTRASHVRRALSYLSLYPLILWRALRLPRHDVVVILTDPPLLLVLGPLLAGLKGSRWIHWAQDIYPELAEEMGVLRRRGLPARCLRQLSTWAMCRCDALIAVGRCMKARLAARGVALERIRVIPNWGHGSALDSAAAAPPSGDRAANSFRREHGFGDRFVVMYSGNLGLAHPFEAIIDAAGLLEKTAPHVLFVFVGEGPRLPWVKQRVADLQLTNVRFLPFQPKEKLAQSLAAADLHLASMREDLSGLVVPSKVAGILAAGRPCVFLGPHESEAAQLILDCRCGSVLERASGDVLAECLRSWFEDANRLRIADAMGKAAIERVSFWPALDSFMRLFGQLVSGANAGVDSKPVGISADAVNPAARRTPVIDPLLSVSERQRVKTPKPIELCSD